MYLIRKFVAECAYVCCFFLTKEYRARIRMYLRYPNDIPKYIKYVKKNYTTKTDKISIRYGYGCLNLVIIVKNKYVFKFPLASGMKNNLKNRVNVEKRILDAFRNISPIYIPKMEIINWNGIYVRKYEFIKGNVISEYNSKMLTKNVDKIASQLAHFMYVISQSNPAEIQDLKPIPTEKVSYLTGWTHGDIGGNFILDSECNIVGFIDWECAHWGNICDTFRPVDTYWGRFSKDLFVKTIFKYGQFFIDEK